MEKWGKENRFPWIYDRIRSVTSQCGEDGILEAIFEKIGETNRQFVDVGACDPINISNSYDLVSNKNWHGVLIEMDNGWYQKCKNHYSDRDDVHCLHTKVSRDNTIDKILDSLDFPEVYDVLSIDIDSIDYFVWKDHQRYKPRVVIVECNPSIDTDISFIQKDFSRENINIGNSARALVDLGKEMGYELVAHLFVNCIFVLKEEFHKLEIGDNSLERLFTSPFIPKVITDQRGNHFLIKPGVWGFKSISGLEQSLNDGYNSSIALYNAVDHEAYDVNYNFSAGELTHHSDWNVAKMLKTFINATYKPGRNAPPWSKD
jgi:hypothetical protein